MLSLTRRTFAKAAASAALLAAAPPGLAHAAADKTLRFIAQSDLRVLDPIWTTAYISRNHGYCVFDTLFAIDAEFAPHPQMVGDFSISPDKLTYQFKLRDGLGFHDGSPVRGADCVASVKRWMARDSHGQSLMTVLDEIKPDGDKGFTIKLKEPFTLLDRRLRQGVEPGAVHHARAARQHRSVHPDHRDGRLRAAQIRQGGVPAGPSGRLRQERRLRAAQGAVELGLGRQGREGRPRRVALYPRRDDQGGRAQRRRGGLVGEPAARPGAGAGRQPRHHHRAGPTRCPARSWSSSTTCSRPSTM